MTSSLCLMIGNKARDLLYKNYRHQEQQRLHYPHGSIDWRFGFSCQIEEMLPGLDTIFGLSVPDSGKAELQYANNFVSINAGVGLRANPSRGLDPVPYISGVIGNNFVSIGAGVGFDVSKRTLDQFDAGLSFNSPFLTASLNLEDFCKSIKVSGHCELNPQTQTAVAAELKHSLLTGRTDIIVGGQRGLSSFTLLKARVSTDGKVAAVIQQEVRHHFYVSFAGQMDFRGSNNMFRIGFSVALKP